MTARGADQVLSTATLENRREFLARTGCVMFGAATIGAMYPSETAFADGCDVGSLAGEVKELILSKASPETIIGLQIVITGGAVYWINPLLGFGIMMPGHWILRNAYKQVVGETLEILTDRCFRSSR